jgi:hypothetical protein
LIKRIDVFAKDGTAACEREKENNRDDKATIMDIKETILVEGNQDWTSGVPVIRNNARRGRFEFIILSGLEL